MRDTGLTVDLDKPVAELPVGERQRLEILKALYRGARILILDEPTAVLTPQETEPLFVTLRGLRERGTTVLLITHKLKEIMALVRRGDGDARRRGGARLRRSPTPASTALAEAMVGRRVQLGRARRRHARAPRPARCCCRRSGLSWRDALGVPRLADVSLHAARRRDRRHRRRLGQRPERAARRAGRPAGAAAPARCRSAAASSRRRTGSTRSQARELRIAHVPEDRHRRGLVLPFPAWESAVLGYQQRAALQPRAAGCASARCATTPRAMMERYDVRPRNPRCARPSSRGGNQQKLVLAREALPEPQVLLVGQPTRGVDIGAIEFIHGRLRAMRDAGGAVLLVSSELDEILALADRVHRDERRPHRRRAADRRSAARARWAG